MTEYIPRRSPDPRWSCQSSTRTTHLQVQLDVIELYHGFSSKMVKVKLIEYNGKPFLFISDDGLGMDIQIMDMSKSLHRTHGKFNFGGKAGTLHLVVLMTIV